MPQRPQAEKNAYMREWLKRDSPASERARRRRAQWRIDHPRRRKHIQRMGELKRQIGRRVPDEEISALFEQSDGLCAICADEVAVTIDHDHVTLQLRGALCKGCNWGLGHFRDDPAKLRAAAEYLETPVLRG